MLCNFIKLVTLYKIYISKLYIFFFIGDRTLQFLYAFIMVEYPIALLKKNEFYPVYACILEKTYKYYFHLDCMQPLKIFSLNSFKFTTNYLESILKSRIQFFCPFLSDTYTSIGLDMDFIFSKIREGGGGVSVSNSGQGRRGRGSSEVDVNHVIKT